MSINEKILKILNTPQNYYKGIPVNCFGFPVFKEYNKQSIRNSFSKMKQKEFIKINDSYVKITKQGQNYLINKNSILKSFEFSIGKNDKRDLLVLFDIPEEQRKERTWFRRHLIKFGYIMIQRSVWVGPSPLPKEFINYTKEIKIKDCIKTFKLAKSYT